MPGENSHLVRGLSRVPLHKILVGASCKHIVVLGIDLDAIWNAFASPSLQNNISAHLRRVRKLLSWHEHGSANLLHARVTRVCRERCVKPHMLHHNFRAHTCYVHMLVRVPERIGLSPCPNAAQPCRIPPRQSAYRLHRKKRYAQVSANNHATFSKPPSPRP